jgi:hypothetical protein
MIIFGEADDAAEECVGAARGRLLGDVRVVRVSHGTDVRPAARMVPLVGGIRHFCCHSSGLLGLNAASLALTPKTRFRPSIRSILASQRKFS